jgi:hypothetical protein
VVLVVAALGVAGVLADRQLRAAREDDAARVLAAVGSGDCATVAASYRAATTAPALLWRRPPIAADVARAAADCRDLARIDALAVSGRRDEALGRYLEFRRGPRFSPLYEHVPDRIGKVLRAGRLTPDTRTCGLLAQLVAVGEAPAPEDAMPGLLTTCGELLATSRDENTTEREWAAVLLTTVRRQYGGWPEAARAEAGEAALLVRKRPGASDLPRPRRISGSPGPGLVRVVYENHTRDAMTFVISGRGGGRVVELVGCRVCPELDDGEYCTGKGNKVVVTLPAGSYRVRMASGQGIWVTEWSGTWRLRPGTYASCMGTTTS